MAIKLANFIATTLGEAISGVATSFAVASTAGFPTLGVSDYFYLVLTRASDGANEIVKVTAWSSGQIDTCVRAQEDTDAIAFVAGDAVKLAVTAQTLQDMAAFPSLTITVGAGALSKTISCQASVAGRYIIRAWLIDGSTPTDQQTLNPPDGSNVVQWEKLTDADGLAEFTVEHTGAQTSWYLCAELCGRVEISAIITLGV